MFLSIGERGGGMFWYYAFVVIILIVGIVAIIYAIIEKSKAMAWAGFAVILIFIFGIIFNNQIVEFIANPETTPELSANNDQEPPFADYDDYPLLPTSTPTSTPTATSIPTTSPTTTPTQTTAPTTVPTQTTAPTQRQIPNLQFPISSFEVYEHTNVIAWYRFEVEMLRVTRIDYCDIGLHLTYEIIGTLLETENNEGRTHISMTVLFYDNEDTHLGNVLFGPFGTGSSGMISVGERFHFTSTINYVFFETTRLEIRDLAGNVIR